MKIFFDRLTDLITVKKEKGRALKHKSIFLIAVGSDSELPEGFEIPLKKTTAYFNMYHEACLYFPTKYLKTYVEKPDYIKPFINKLKNSLTES